MGIQHEMNMRNLKRYGADGRKKGVRHQAGPIWRPIRVDGGVSSWLKPARFFSVGYDLKIHIQRRSSWLSQSLNISMPLPIRR